MAKQKKSETKIRRVTAKSDRPKNKPAKTTKKSSQKEQAQKPKTSKYAAKVSGKKVKKQRKPLPKFLRVIFTPFVVTGRYFKSAWGELKLVRWPTRSETWKMTFAVIIFSVAFGGLILFLDMIFNWLFTTFLG